MGALSAVFACCGGMGFCFLCGLQMVSTAMVTPFLVMGIGLDDMFVVINSYSLAFMIDKPRDRCAMTLRDCGIGITITTLTNLLSFAIGSASPYLAIRNFCIFTFCALLTGYVMVLTIFFAFVCLDSEREARNDVCLCNCRKRNKPKKNSTRKSLQDMGCKDDDRQIAPARSAASVSTFSMVSHKARWVNQRKRLRYTQQRRESVKLHEEFEKRMNAITTDDPQGGEVMGGLTPGGIEKGETAIELETEEVWSEPRGTVGRLWRRFFLYYFGQWITNPLTKVVVILFFATYLAISYVGFSKLPQGLEFSQLASDTSYLQTFEMDVNRYFYQYGPPTSIFFTEKSRMWLPEARNSLLKLHNKMTNAPYSIRLLDPLKEFHSSAYFLAKVPNMDAPVDEELYVEALKDFLEDPFYKRYSPDISLDGSKLKGWKMTLLPINIISSKERGQWMSDMRSDLKDFPGLDPIPFTFLFTFYESDLEIMPQVISNLSFAAVAMFTVAMMLMPQITAGILVMMTMAMIDLGLFGFMYYWDLQLNMISMINLVISIGFSVDYSAHICHTFTHCQGETRDLRAVETLVLMGNPMLHGAMSTQLGVLMLGFSGSYIFRVFFKMMTMVLIFGVTHGVILLPVILSLIGPMGDNRDPEAAAALSNEPKDVPSPASTVSPRRLKVGDMSPNRTVSEDSVVAPSGLTKSETSDISHEVENVQHPGGWRKGQSSDSERSKEGSSRRSSSTTRERPKSEEMVGQLLEDMKSLKKENANIKRKLKNLESEDINL
eukprot:GHVL01010318.1.p1 GENE.GHVL01010318.1~~GHVL01010318.1.p1  ORF type:complete len:775 (-),score=121.43 GHVL01010318.1:80-2404(-)